MELGGEISSAPRTIDSCRLNKQLEQTKIPQRSNQSVLDRNANSKALLMADFHEICKKLMWAFRSFIFAPCFANINFLSHSNNQSCRNVSKSNNGSPHQWELVQSNVNYHCEPYPRLGKRQDMKRDNDLIEIWQRLTSQNFAKTRRRKIVGINPSLKGLQV